MKPERRAGRFEIKLTVAAALIFAATLLGIIANPGRPVYPVEEWRLSPHTRTRPSMLPRASCRKGK